MADLRPWMSSTRYYSAVGASDDDEQSNHDEEESPDQPPFLYITCDLQIRCQPYEYQDQAADQRSYERVLAFFVLFTLLALLGLLLLLVSPLRCRPRFSLRLCGSEGGAALRAKRHLLSDFLAASRAI